MKHPMGTGLRGKAITYYYKATPQEEIWPQLKNEGIKTLDYIFLTHPHADHIAGIETRDIPVNQICINENNLYPTFTNWLNYPLSMIKRLNLNRGFPKTKDIKPISLPGHTPNHTGFRAGNIAFFENTKKTRNSLPVAFVGDALESIISLDDPVPPKRFSEDTIAKGKTIMKLRELAKQGILLLSSYDLFLKPTQGQNLLESQQYSDLMSKKERVLTKINDP